MHLVVYGTRPSRTIRDRLRTVFYAGTRYHCPFCGFNSRRWTPIGWDLPVISEKKVAGAGRRDAGCFRCGSNDRERLMYHFLEREGFLGRMHELRVLHIAPEIVLREFFQQRCEPREYIIGDKKSSGYKYPKEVVDVDVTALPFPDGRFDLVLCNHVLEHVPDDGRAMAEIKRVLVPGGTAVLQVPFAWGIERTEEDPSVTDPKERERLYGQFDHVRLYGKDYTKRLEAAGFEVSLLLLGKDPASRRLGLSKEEPLVKAVRPLD